MEWNEENFDITANVYVQEAYNAGKFAFVSDYARLFALYHYGGIYMDTDVEVLKSLNRFLVHFAFSGFENKTSIATAIMGGRKKNAWIKTLLDWYTDRHFVKEDGSFDLTTNVAIVSKLAKEKYGINLNNELQDITDIVTIYPQDYFCPKSFITGIIALTENTCVIHHYSASWVDEKERRTRDINFKIIKIFGGNIGTKIVAAKYYYNKGGLRCLLKRIACKLT